MNLFGSQRFQSHDRVASTERFETNEEFDACDEVCCADDEDEDFGEVLSAFFFCSSCVVAVDSFYAAGVVMTFPTAAKVFL